MILAIRLKICANAFDKNKSGANIATIGVSEAENGIGKAKVVYVVRVDNTRYIFVQERGLNNDYIVYKEAESLIDLDSSRFHIRDCNIRLTVIGERGGVGIWLVENNRV